PVGHRFIAWTSLWANYSDDFGETWSTPVPIAPGEWGGPRSTELVNTESILIPLVGSPYFAVSYDNGETFSNIGSQSIPAIAIRGSVGIGYLNDGLGTAVGSVDSGLSWTAVGNTGMHAGVSHRWLASSDQHYVMSGIDNDGAAAVSATTTGSIWKTTILDSAAGRSAHVVKWATSGTHPGGRWVTILDNGDIYFADDPEGAWTKAQGNLGGRFPTGLTHNGVRWIASGNTAGMSGGAIFTSEDGDVWTQRAQGLLGVASVCALSQ